ncbi:MAG: phosphoribosylformylglycinamidine cyclo-ligase [Phycisphaeraceae bacterium]
MSGDAYAQAGVDTGRASKALTGLVAALGAIDPGRPSRSLVRSGHFASVIDLDGRTGIAICTDGVGTKLIVAEQARRLDTVGIDCVAMCVNDLICVGAEPLAMVDYIAVEHADPEVLAAIGAGLRAGAERAGIEIPGGELAQLPEVIRGHPSPGGLDLVGAGFGAVAVDSIVTGEKIEPGDIVIGLPSSGIHSNGFTLARRALLEHGGHSLDDAPPPLTRPIADELLEPTEIYVRAVRELLGSHIDVHGLAHITGDGLANLLRLNAQVGFEIDDPLPTQPVFDLIASAGEVPSAAMYKVFNMGTGFCCVTTAADEQTALGVLRSHYHDAKRIGHVTERAGSVRVAGFDLS